MSQQGSNKGKDLMRYDLLAQEALKGVVRQALTRAASPDGLPGAHELYIGFRTHASGVEMPEYLAVQYPEEMTIVLRDYYWDLEISDNHFRVGLSFNQKPETLSIPFAAITRFYDPIPPFGLQFDVAAEVHHLHSVDLSRAKTAELKGNVGEAEEVYEGAKVLRLDAFRNKA